MRVEAMNAALVGARKTRDGKDAKVLFVDDQLYGVIRLDLPRLKWGAVRWSMEGRIYGNTTEHAHDLALGDNER